MLILFSFIPRKPHPNGLIQWSAACQGARYGIPIIIYFMWDREGRRAKAHDAIISATDRLSPRVQASPLHWTADSAWGSVNLLQQLKERGITATFSMSKNSFRDLWNTIGQDLGLSEGRAVYDPTSGIVFAAMRVLNDENKPKLLKTATTGVALEGANHEEQRVAAILNRRESEDSEVTEYLTAFDDGTQQWLPMDSFIDDDGTINVELLDFAEKEDLRKYFETLTVARLAAIAESKGWRVCYFPFNFRYLC